MSEARTLELVFPEHANPGGNAFGGFVLGLMDKVGSYAAIRRARKRCVTVRVGEVVFEVPIKVGDLLEVVARVVRVGRTSLTVEVEVYRENLREPKMLATKGNLTYVAVDEQGRPVPVDEPPPSV
ncbi:MAG: acyl-CoA thioesterase [Meiothermus sp.]|uniref:acyl-CoA thioesterase n=1 Tax=Meiothermus sp. TaxID=1955249 RepID=UPI0026010C59|nr:hotdog domain-containing protein [Meiothermus sp.]MCS7057391.1 acyl-CoA thioesterase [Meiothermus sp.]MCS7193604.1 acyl-CoA thioesterase [Meiothermus sp.]MDW8090618.1 hotdog domain-containing protein [Meiothermus sp.]MDW8480534.1 hotdog domain-containing protein [Meiothermus sp.]